MLRYRKIVFFSIRLEGVISDNSNVRQQVYIEKDGSSIASAFDAGPRQPGGCDSLLLILSASNQNTASRAKYEWLFPDCTYLAPSRSVHL
jgi:hypothetical protein